MLTPSELRSKQVEPRKKRYDKEEMDEFLELVYTNYNEIHEQNRELKKKIKTLSDGIQYYHSIEKTLQQALILAEKTAKETKEAAILKAEAIEKEAKIKAEEIINSTEQEYVSIKQKCVHLVKQFDQYKLQLMQAANAQIELIESSTFNVYTPELNLSYEEKFKEIEKKEETVNPRQLEVENTVSYAEPKKEEITDPSKEEKVEPLIEPIIAPIQEPPKEENIQEKPQIEFKEPLRETSNESDMVSLFDPAVPVISTAESVTSPINPTVILEPINSSPLEPMNAKVINVKDTTPLEPISIDIQGGIDLQEQSPQKSVKKEEPQTLDNLLKDLNMSSSKSKASKKNRSSEDDPFDFLGSVEDF